jgi:urease accessory protein
MNTMTELPNATGLLRAAARGPQVPYGTVVLGHDERFLRRRRLVTAAGEAFLVDLAETASLSEGDCFRLTDGRLVEVVSAEEAVLVITGDLPRLAWHIGNRHTPCQIEADRLVIRADHVLEAMLRQLGATVTPARAAFSPEGGAYGHGRTMGHDHGPAHGHDHLHVHHHASHRGGVDEDAATDAAR